VNGLIDENSPANGQWFMNISNQNSANPVTIAFNSTGDIDLVATNAIFPDPSISTIPTGLDDVTYWKTVNTIFVALYWTTLADLGQLTPVFLFGNQTNYAPGPQYNIIANATLANLYNDFINNTYAPTPSEILGADFAQWDNGTSTSFQTVFYQEYSCTKLVSKAPIGVLVALAGSCYALINGGYKGLTFAIRWWFKPSYQRILLSYYGS
jgi:hypothetical protein